jgi:tRNA (guanine10-N2)-methyltransferase
MSPSLDPQASSSKHFAPYLLHIPRENESFRVPELFACAKLFDFDIRIVEEDPVSPFLIVELESDEHAKRITERCVLVK